MKQHLISVLLLASSVFGEDWNKFNQGHIPRDPTKPRPSHVTSLRSHELPQDVPDEWDWGSVNGTNFLTLPRNQHLPTYCGSCWAHAATSSLSDRIKIARNAQWPDINIAPQVLISCGPGEGCHGGYASDANEWIHKNGITDETCSIYQARGHDNGLPCSAVEICETCDTHCYQPKHYYKYGIDEYDDVRAAIMDDTPELEEKAMKAEIFHRGPISCGISVTQELVNFTGSGIFYDKTGADRIMHDISVVGYGIQDERKYWKVRNSWGTYWGDKGYFKLARGVNNLGIESGTCSWATPKDTWTNAEKERRDILDNATSPKEPFLDRLFKVIAEFIKNANKRQVERSNVVRKQPCILKDDVPVESRVISPLPSEYLTDEELPENFDWRNVNGVNKLSWTVNQHIPQYCGSCWAQCAASALADRFILFSKDKGLEDEYVNLALSVQAILNCRMGGDCDGGRPLLVYLYAHSLGIPHFTCQPYQAKNLPLVNNCTNPETKPEAEEMCKNCAGPPPKLGEEGNCWAVKKYRNYYADEYSLMDENVMHIKKEIFARGPISCALMVTDGFLNYSGGVYREYVPAKNITVDHGISVVGWGKDKEVGDEYWIARNSWGTYWGEMGFFRIRIGDLGMEQLCSWGTPDFNRR